MIPEEAVLIDTWWNVNSSATLSAGARLQF